MIVLCPNCNSKSRVDKAIASNNTRVRCSNCQQIFIPSLMPNAPIQAPVDQEQTAAFVDLHAIESQAAHASPAPTASTDDGTDLVARQHLAQRQADGGNSHILGGIALVFLLTGFVFYAQGNAIYASLGLLGGRPIVLLKSSVQTPLVIEQMVSTTYTLTNGHQALVALGTVRNTSAQPAEKMEVDFRVTQPGQPTQQVRAPLGAVLSLEELATVPTQGDPVEELRQRAQQVPPLAGHAGGQKFMAILMDPPANLDQAQQSATLATAIAPTAPTPAPTPVPVVPASAMPNRVQEAWDEQDKMPLQPTKVPSRKASAVGAHHPHNGHKSSKKHRNKGH